MANNGRDHSLEVSNHAKGKGEDRYLPIPWQDTYQPTSPTMLPDLVSSANRPFNEKETAFLNRDQREVGNNDTDSVFDSSSRDSLAIDYVKLSTASTKEEVFDKQPINQRDDKDKPDLHDSGSFDTGKNRSDSSTGSHPSELTTSTSKSSGLKGHIPCRRENVILPTTSSFVQGGRKDGHLKAVKGSAISRKHVMNESSNTGTKAESRVHPSITVTSPSFEASINYSNTSGRRSAPIFSRRYFGGPTALRGSNQSLTNNTDRSSSVFFGKFKQKPPKGKTKTYGSLQNDTQQCVKAIRSSCHNMNQSDASHGYWSECETDRRDSQDLNAEYFSDGPFCQEYRNEWSLSQESIYEEDDDDDQTDLTYQRSQLLPFFGGNRRCKSNPPPSVRYFKGQDQQPTFDRTVSPYYIDNNLKNGNIKNHLNDDDRDEEDGEKIPILNSVKKKVKSDDDDDSSSSSSDVQTAVYKRRWYVLFVFSMYCLVWNAIWSTWGPIAQSAKAVFDWTDGDIAMFTWLGNIPFLVTMFPIAYLMDVKGMRISMVLSTGLSFLGAGLRCITLEPATATWLIDAGQLLNGIAGTVPISGAALVSGLWFPPNQRATATGISTITGYLGVCISFLAGPLLIPEPVANDPANTTSLSLSDTFNNGSSNGTIDLSVQRDGISNLLYFEGGAAGFIFLLTLFYFPSKPPLPPSVSASMPRESYLKGLKMLVCNKQFWLTALAFSVPVGVYEVWQIVLDVNLDPKVSQETAGWMDFYATLGGCASGLIVSRFADSFTRQIRLFLIVFYMLSAAAALWFTLLALEILPFDMVSIYSACVICGLFLDGAAPLFFELVVEVSYPAGEGVTSGFLQMVCAGAGVLFLSFVQIEEIGKGWMNWCLFGCIAASVPMLFFIQAPLGRADIDDGVVSSSDEDSDEEKLLETGIDRLGKKEFP